MKNTIDITDMSDGAAAMETTKPTIHLNGTSPEALADAYREAVGALASAHAAMQACSPNARDYYVQDGQAALRADKEHMARMQAISDIRLEMADLFEHVMDQWDAVEASKAKRS